MSHYNLYVGIDPGVNGGIACINETYGKATVKVESMPPTERGLWEWFERLKLVYSLHSLTAYIEHVTGYVGKQSTGAHMFKLAGTYWGCRMAMIGNGIKFEKVAASAWQNALEIEPKGSKTDSQHKNVLKVKACSLFPETKVTLKQADALLIAHYCRLRVKRDI